MLVEERTPIRRELYASVVSDSSSQGPLVCCSTEGGMDIEEVAARSPGRLHYRPVDIRRGFTQADAAELVRELGLDSAGGDLAGTLARLYDAYIAFDAELLEVNPLAITHDGRVVALDCKLVMDDCALVRQRDAARAGIARHG